MKKLGFVEILESKLDLIPMIETGIESRFQVDIHKKPVPRLRECLVPAKLLLTEGCELVVIPAIIEEMDKELTKQLDKNIMSLEVETGRHIFLRLLDFEDIDQKDEKKMQEQVMKFVSDIVEYSLAFLLEDKSAMKKILEAEKEKEKKRDTGDLI